MLTEISINYDKNKPGRIHGISEDDRPHVCDLKVKSVQKLHYRKSLRPPTSVIFKDGSRITLFMNSVNKVTLPLPQTV